MENWKWMERSGETWNKEISVIRRPWSETKQSNLSPVMEVVTKRSDSQPHILDV